MSQILAGLSETLYVGRMGQHNRASRGVAPVIITCACGRLYPLTVNALCDPWSEIFHFCLRESLYGPGFGFCSCCGPYPQLTRRYQGRSQQQKMQRTSKTRKDVMFTRDTMQCITQPTLAVLTKHSPTQDPGQEPACTFSTFLGIPSPPVCPTRSVDTHNSATMAFLGVLAHKFAIQCTAGPTPALGVLVSRR